MPLSSLLGHARRCNSMATWAPPPEIGEGPIHVPSPLGGGQLMAFAFADQGVTPMTGTWRERWVIYDQQRFFARGVGAQSVAWSMLYQPVPWRTKSWPQIRQDLEPPNPVPNPAPPPHPLPAQASWTTQVDYQPGAPSGWTGLKDGWVYTVRGGSPGGQIVGFHLRIDEGMNNLGHEYWLFLNSYNPPDAQTVVHVVPQGVPGTPPSPPRLSPPAFSTLVTDWVNANGAAVLCHAQVDYTPQPGFQGVP